MVPLILRKWRRWGEVKAIRINRIGEHRTRRRATSAGEGRERRLDKLSSVHRWLSQRRWRRNGVGTTVTTTPGDERGGREIRGPFGEGRRRVTLLKLLGISKKISVARSRLGPGC